MVAAEKVFAKSSPDTKRAFFFIFFLQTGHGSSNLDLGAKSGLNLGFCHSDTMANTYFEGFLYCQFAIVTLWQKPITENLQNRCLP